MLTVITGPPCSGKSTYIAERAKRGHIIIDLDRIALALTTDDTPHHGYHHGIRWVAIEARRAALAAAIRQHLNGATVWAIDTDPSPKRREFYRRAGGTVVDLDPGIETVMARAISERPDHVIEYIREWYATHPTPPATRSRQW